MNVNNFDLFQIVIFWGLIGFGITYLIRYVVEFIFGDNIPIYISNFRMLISLIIIGVPGIIIIHTLNLDTRTNMTLLAGVIFVTSEALKNKIKKDS